MVEHPDQPTAVFTPASAGLSASHRPITRLVAAAMACVLLGTGYQRTTADAEVPQERVTGEQPGDSDRQSDEKSSNKQQIPTLVCPEAAVRDRPSGRSLPTRPARAEDVAIGAGGPGAPPADSAGTPVALSGENLGIERPSRPAQVARPVLADLAVVPLRLLWFGRSLCPIGPPAA